MRIFYLSSVDVIDTDMNVLPHLSKMHEIVFGLLIPGSNYSYWGKELNRIKGENKLIQLRSIRLKYRRRNPFNIPIYIRLILSIRRGRYDIIYVNDFEDIYFRLLFAVFIRKDKTLCGIHDVAYHSGWKYKILKGASRELFLRKFDTVLTFSQSQAKLLESKYRRVFSVPMALKRFGDNPDIKKDYSIIQFLFFGTIASYKGLDMLITVIKKLSLKYNNFRLIIAGRCNEWTSVYEPMVANNKNIFTDIRRIENEEIPYYFASSHYLILPYKDVTQSGPLMIAYYYQVPVIASDLEGFREYIQEGTTGFTFSVGKEDQLEKAIENSILRKKEAYEHLVSNLKDSVSKKYGAATIASKYDKVFKKVYES
ncbi:MAG: glycosyltransferase family 4 protein [Sediminibacterium magnilacihabitans]|jgi:glycosyltransferase involved in cell wall biosynthesis|nr:glycosyltransferase family 4 protein [Sediminibacterium magnilacihabitans]PQV61627.1 glycosyltransferase involved in cell wall biosynthesis [Sediminibacterium magnilacihabitans]